MSAYLGIEPTKRPDYYFVSYNNEDAERLSPLMKQLVHYNVPLWYDYGLEYGEQWQTEIANRIQGCQAMLLFVTKGIFEKTKPYVTVEYEIATQYRDKKVYVILVDDIQKNEIPNSLLSWWIDISHKQTLPLYRYNTPEERMEQFKRMLKIHSFEERTGTIMERYAELVRQGEITYAEQLLKAVLHGKELETKAKIMSRLFSDGYASIKTTYLAETMEKRTLATEMCTIGRDTFRAECRTVFRRIGAGDADVIDVFRSGECIYTIGGLVDATNGELFYDEKEDLLYIVYSSYPNVHIDHEFADTAYLSICIVEDPCGEAVCHDYRNEGLCNIAK